MKRPRQRRTGTRPVDITLAFTSEQLERIGRVAMAYNEAEEALHHLLTACVRFPGDAFELVSRINGTEGITALVLVAVRHLKLDAKTTNLFGDTVAAFLEVKSYRDSSIHSRLVDKNAAVAFTYKRQGKIDEVLVSVDSLDRLYAAIVVVTDELNALTELVESAWRLRRIKQRESAPAASDQEKERLAKSIQAASAQCRLHQSRRRSLKPYPKFPVEQPAMVRAKSAAKSHPVKS